MFLPIATIALSVFISTSVGAGSVWNGMTAIWNQNHSLPYYKIPSTIGEAVNAGWTEYLAVNRPEGVTALTYQEDLSLILLFSDDSQLIIGLSIAFLKSDVKDTGQPNDLEEHDDVFSQEINGQWYYVAKAWFSKNESTDTRGIIFEKKSGPYEIPTDTALLISETPYKLKNCIPGMGDHYYEWDSTSSCNNLGTWAVMAVGNDVIGIVFQTFGQASTVGKWEKLPKGAIRATIPDAPQCAIDAADTWGVISIHFWFVDYPQGITCS